MKNLYLYLIVFVSGASVLAIEILGTRILGPFYGVSLFLWSALITVTLAALSVGYLIGGRLADKGPTIRRLCLIIAVAGTWLLIIPWIKYPILDAANPFGLRFAVLVAAFLLFAVPLTLLGMVGPYAIRLRTSSVKEVGRISGNIFAISTVASVFSALLTGFFLIPNFGINRLTLSIGVILIITSFVGLFANLILKFISLAVGIIFLIFITSFWNYNLDGLDPKRGVIAIEQSAYGEIRVIDIKDKRHLVIDGGVHSFVDQESWKSHFPYVPVMDINKLFFKNQGDMLLIGLGGGSIVKNYERDKWAVDVVEIDPVVSEIARKYFDLESSNANIYTEDGRKFLINRKKKYDLIIMDAYGSSSIPFHLITSESFGLIASRLKPGGIFAVNIYSLGWRDVMVKSLAETLITQFKQVVVLPITEPPNILGNLVVIASDRELDISEELLGRPKDFLFDKYLHWYTLQINHAWDNRFVPEKDDETKIFTDDLNPVDLMNERIKLKGREVLHAYFGKGGLNW